MSAKVWVLGDAVVDLLPESDGRLLPCPGGAPANVAVGIARLGGTSGFIGRVGDDPFGALMQRTLLTEGVDITYLKQDEWHRTSTVLVDLNDQGERSFTFMVRPSADLFLETTDLPCWRHGEWLHLCSIALSAEPSRTSAFTAMTAIRHAGGLSASILIFVKIYGKTSICSACVCGRRYNWRMSSSSRKKNGDLSVEKHRTIGIYAPWQKSMRSPCCW